MLEHGTGKPTLAGIIEEHAPFVRRTLAQLGVRTCDLDDVEQEVHRGVARGLPAFDPSLAKTPETAVRGWLFGICERQAASHRRDTLKRGEVLSGAQDLDGATTAVTAEDLLAAQERLGLFPHLLSRLHPARRAVVVAYELEGVRMVDMGAAPWRRKRFVKNPAVAGGPLSIGAATG